MSFDFSKRKIAKTLPGGEVPDRNTQFEHITRLRKRYQSRGNPVFSIDTKKKEHLGHLDRDGRVYCQEPFQRIGQIYYPDATSILWLCAAGGSNNYRHYIFKQDLQQLVDEIGIQIRVAH